MLVLGGQSGETRLRRTRIRAALAPPGSLRLEGLAPFGAPGFIFVADDERATLLLPRERRVVRDARPREVLHALAGLALDPENFRALLTGCLVPHPTAVAARAYANEWIAVELEHGAIAYLRDVDGVPAIVAGTRDEFTVEYSDHVRGLPRQVRVRSVGPAGVTDLTAALSQVNVNTELRPETFLVAVPEGYEPMTLAQLQGAPPLEDRAAPGASPEP